MGMERQGRQPVLLINIENWPREERVPSELLSLCAVDPSVYTLSLSENLSCPLFVLSL